MRGCLQKPSPFEKASCRHWPGHKGPTETLKVPPNPSPGASGCFPRMRMSLPEGDPETAVPAHTRPSRRCCHPSWISAPGAEDGGKGEYEVRRPLTGLQPRRPLGLSEPPFPSVSWDWLS